MDCPDKVLWDPCDVQPMFKHSTILYLRPLALAIYMRRKAIVQILLESGLVDSGEISYAADVCTLSESNTSTDLLELTPAVVAVRRNFFNALPILYSSHTQSRRQCVEEITLHYVNKGCEKVVHYEDILAYAMEMAKGSRWLHIARLFDTLILQCSDFFVAQTGHLFCLKHSGQKCSLFLRIVKSLVLEDPLCRLSFQLIQSLERIVRLKLFYKEESSSTQQKISEDSKTLPLDIRLRELQLCWPSFSFYLKDCLYSFALLFKLYEILLNKRNNRLLFPLCELLYQISCILNCWPIIKASYPEELQRILKFLLNAKIYHQTQTDLDESSPVPLEVDENMSTPMRSKSSNVCSAIEPPSVEILQKILDTLIIFDDAGRASISGQCYYPINAFEKEATLSYAKLLSTRLDSICILCQREGVEKKSLICTSMDRISSAKGNGFIVFDMSKAREPVEKTFEKGHHSEITRVRCLTHFGPEIRKDEAGDQELVDGHCGGDRHTIENPHPSGILVPGGTSKMVTSSISSSKFEDVIHLESTQEAILREDTMVKRDNAAERLKACLLLTEDLEGIVQETSTLQEPERQQNAEDVDTQKTRITCESSEALERASYLLYKPLIDQPEKSVPEHATLREMDRVIEKIAENVTSMGTDVLSPPGLDALMMEDMLEEYLNKNHAGLELTTAMHLGDLN
ncbi:unnamed protein product [Schistocephalus solidus]|uniref:Protein kinase domain-containing protein n=1 Tax=Schistocephalus solidus TaxID=70667 RepID=A0A183SXC3_SCHSO|nr:unnamed protein product [Schistocephalus solidus]